MNQAALSTKFGLARVFAPDAVAVMQSYDWPGNVRQLRNVIEWLLIMAAGEAEVPITAEMLPPDLRQKAAAMVHGQGARSRLMIEAVKKRPARFSSSAEYLQSQVQPHRRQYFKETAGFIGMERPALHH